MKTAVVRFTSCSPYTQSRYYQTEKLPKELPKDYEARTWRDRMHVDENDQVFIPPMAIKNCLSECSKFLGLQIPGKGKSTYTKHFEAGVMIMEPVPLGINKNDVPGQWLHVPADGVRGSGKRVEKCFPVIRSWTGDATIYVLDETITKDVLLHHLEEAGKFIGLGSFRPRNNGFFGRFTVEMLSFG